MSCILHIPTYIITFGPLANPKQRLPSGFFNMRDYVVYVAFKIFQFSITIIHAKAYALRDARVLQFGLTSVKDLVKS